MGGEIKSLFNHIRDDLHDLVKNYRNVENFIANKEIELIFDEYKDKDKVHSWIMHGKIEELKNWFDTNRKLLPLEYWSVDMLRKEAGLLKIQDYLIMNKGTLITTLKRRKNGK